MFKNIILFSVFLFCSVFLFSQTNPDNEKSEKTVKEIRTEKLLYGINSEILDLLKSLKDEKNSDFNEPLLQVLKETKNSKVKENIIDLYIDTEYFSADAEVFKIIEEKEYSAKNVVRKSIKYLSLSKPDKYKNDFLALLDSNDESYRSEAVKALSSTGDKQFTMKLIEHYENDESESVKLEILLNIGELKDPDSSEFLMKIIDDEYIDKTSRQYAIHSLGLIVDDEAFPLLMKTYEDPDPYIRSYALDAISKYKKNESEEILLQALKDDSWQIRKQAAVSASEYKNEKLVPLLIYKAVNDPAEPVRIESVKALSAIGSQQSLSFLREKASEKKAAVSLRKLALVEIIKNDLSGSYSVIEKILEDEWESPGSFMLDTACSALSETKSDKLTDLYSRMLDHPSLTVKLSGMKGIKLNKCSTLKEKVSKFTGEDVSSSVRNYAKSVVEEL